MTNNQSPNNGTIDFNLEERTLKFSQMILAFCNKLIKNIENFEMKKQLIRSATSVGANYREANETISNKDFVYKICICRKEAKESNYWIKLLKTNNDHLTEECNQLIDESQQLVKIFTSIITKNTKE